MTLMRVAAANGAVLTYDTDDVENIEISTPGDIRDATPPFTNSREFTGDYHLHLHIDFKHGKKALWIDQATAVLPDLRMGGEILEAALDAEGIPAEVASRIWNRFFFGAPDGIDAVYRFDHDPADCPGRVETTRMRDVEQQWMHGKSCSDAARVETAPSRQEGSPDD